jgi:hypothetical protein
MGRAELPRQNVPANSFADHPADRAMRAASRKDVQFHDRSAFEAEKSNRVACL